MIIQYRTQNDGRNDEISLATALACPPDTDVRQDKAMEADINWILNQYGYAPAQRQIINGATTDYDVGLHQALLMVQRAKEAWRRLPESVRTKFGNWQTMLQAAENNELDLDVDKVTGQIKPFEPPATTPTAPASTNT